MKRARYALFALVIVGLSGAILYKLAFRLAAGIHTHKAQTDLGNAHFHEAKAHLDKAAAYWPDDQTIQKLRGDVCLKMGEREKTAEQSMRLMLKAKSYFLSSSNLNPLEAEYVYALAITESRLERLYRYLNPAGDNPYHALPFFEKAIHLRPNGIVYNYSKARYLHENGMHDELRETVRTLARISPPICDSLKKENFWSPDLSDAFLEGLRNAISSNTRTREAHLAISSLLAEKENWQVAISHYNQGLLIDEFLNNSANYMRLGELYLKTLEKQKAKDSFLTALSMTQSRENFLKKICYHYEKAQLSEEYVMMYKEVADRFYLSPESKIPTARVLMDLERFDQAKSTLADMLQTSPTAEGWYWMARISQKEKDLDHMELYIQKAVMLDPKNSSYHQFFSVALEKQNKMDMAEKEADLAIKHSEKPSHWLFHSRASIRLARKNYDGAADDWRRAITSSPQNAIFHARLAETLVKTANYKAAIESYRKALEIDPQNKQYKSQIEKLNNKLNG